MNWKILGLGLGFVLLFSQCQLFNPNLKIIRKEVRQMATGSLALEDARAAAVAQARRAALEEAHTYLNRYVAIPDLPTSAAGNLVLAAGVFKVRQPTENVITRASLEGIVARAEVRVNIPGLEERVRDLLRHRQHLARLLEADRRSQTLLDRFSNLLAADRRLGLSATAEQRQTLRREFNANTQKLKAQGQIDKVLSRWNGKSYVPQDVAIHWYSEAIRLESDYAYAYTGRGLAYKDKGDYATAIADYDQAIELNPEIAFAYNDRGACYTGLKQYKRAIEDFNVAIRLDPGAAFAYNNRGAAFSKLKIYETAIQDYGQAIGIDPNYALFYSNRGVSYFSLRQYRRAIEDYDQAILLDPELALSYINRGAAYSEQGQFQRAIEDFTQAIERDAENAIAFDRRGYAHYKLELMGKAIRDYNEAMRRDPELASPYSNRGAVYYSMGKMRIAIDDFTQAILRDTDNPANFYARAMA